ncbi:hypothetical protein Gpo141_00000968 [Globisporangium polare]
MNTSEFEPNDPPQRSATISSSGDDRSNSNMLTMTASKANNNNTSPSATTNAANKDRRDGSMDEDMDSGSSPNSLSNETGGPRSTDSSPIDSHSSSSSSSSSNKNSASNSHHHLHLGSSASNSSASPVRRLPSVLRPPTSSVHNNSNNVNGNVSSSGGLAASSARNPQPASDGHLLGQQRQQMYGSSGNGDGTPAGGSPYGAGTAAAMSMRSFYANTMGGGSNVDAQSRSYGHERIHMQPQSAAGSPSALGGVSSANAAHSSSSPHEDMDSDSSARGQKRRLGQFDPRAYSRDHQQQHRSSPSSGPSSSSNNSAGNSNGANVLAAAAAISRQQHHNHLQQQLQYQQQQEQTILHDDDDDDESSSATHFGDSSRGSHGPRDEMRYETWTSKQLRKKCSHLKLRGLKNVKKHVMVEALYRYYRNQRQKELIGGSASTGSSSSNLAAGGSVKASGPSPLTNDQQPSGYSRSSSGGDGARYDQHPSSSAASGTYNSSSNNASMGRSRSGGGSSQSDRTHAVSNSSSSSSQNPTSVNPNALSASSLSRKQQHLAQMHASGAKSPSSATVVRRRAVSYNDDVDMDDRRSETTRDHLDNEIHVTSEDVIRLVDVVLSAVFVDRLAVELSRWQFWVDVREKYIAMLKTTPASNYGSASARAHAGSSSMSDHHDVLNRSSHMSMISSRNFKWSSMQLWEIWKELTFAYTKTCFEFTAAGSDERDYINFCEGRPDVYYLHQRLHARPDLLHLIKSNEYIEEKATSDASESIAHENNTVPLVGNNTVVGNVAGGASPSVRGHKRFKRIVPAPSHQASSSSYGQVTASSVGGNGGASSSAAGNNTTSGSGGSSTVASQNLAGTTRRSGARDFLANSSESSPNAQEDGNGSTENSETTGEEGSESKKSNASSEREVLAEQKYFGLLLQNFEAIFESLHNKKVLLAALRKDSNAPDHLIADLHDDIHVLSALKKEFRNKLRNTLE